MPIVSINLSLTAYDAFQAMSKGSRSRRISYLIERNYGDPNRFLGFVQPDNVGELCRRCKGKVNPMIEEGDVRIMENGDVAKWKNNFGWEMME